MEGQLLAKLPEECVSTILSLTTPLDACNSSFVSTTLRSASDSNLVWDRFLPRDYDEIVSSSDTPLKFLSKKQLFVRLCKPILIDGGKKSFKIEKSSGKKSYILSARNLSITWSDDPMYWSWASLPQSRFSEVAVLRTMCCLEIQGKIRTSLLSPNTKYGAYLLVQISDRSYGLDLMPSEISIEIADQIYNNTAYLRRSGDVNKQELERLMYGNRTQVLKSRVGQGEGRVPSQREDGWMEVELGEFSVTGTEACDEVVKMSLTEVKGHHLKGGLIVEGIEVRPKLTDVVELQNNSGIVNIPVSTATLM